MLLQAAPRPDPPGFDAEANRIVPISATKPPARLRSLENSRPEIVLDESTTELVECLKKDGQLQPIGAVDHGDYGEVIFGHRRLFCILQAGIETVNVLLYPSTMTATEKRIINLSENLKRAGLADQDLTKACAELMKLNLGWKRVDLARHLGKTPDWAPHILSPLSCTPLILEAYFARRIKLAHAYALSKMAMDIQDEQLNRVLAGGTRDDLDRARKRTRPANAAPAVRAVRLKLIMPASGVVITLAGDEGLSLEDAAHELSEALSEIRKAERQGRDAKTLSAVLRDRARAAV